MSKRTRKLEQARPRELARSRAKNQGRGGSAKPAATAAGAIAPSELRFATGSGRHVTPESPALPDVFRTQYHLAPGPAANRTDIERGNIEQHYSEVELAFFAVGEQLSCQASQAVEREEVWWRRLLSLERKTLKEH